MTRGRLHTISLEETNRFIFSNASVLVLTLNCVAYLWDGFSDGDTIAGLRRRHRTPPKRTASSLPQRI